MGARVLALLRRWTVCPDPDDRGLDERWWEAGPREAAAPCRADVAWQRVLGHGYHGVAWYRRRARLPRKWLGQGQRVWLRFESVATDCRVWVNGQEVGSHCGDYVPFEFDITRAVGEEERVEIVCRVDEIKGRPPKVWGEEPWGGHITKGFHDVLGLQHGGIWGGVSVRATGPLAVRPNGLSVAPDPDTGEVRMRLELHPHEAEGAVEFTVLEPGAGAVRRVAVPVGRGAGLVEAAVTCGEVRRWSPASPELGSVQAVARTRGVPARDEAGVRFGFRTFEVGGDGDRQILLNGEPLLLRGVLDWGIEREHIAPAPTREELTERFTELRARGFNCVCLCMVYPPDHFYDVADETGMLVWQIHPVWKSSMAPEHMPEYKRLFDEFFRRDRRHPSVFLVSATCEHECFDADLAAWWWGRGRTELPANLLQVQTGFLQWSDTERMDLFDEHTYDNTGRWVCYMDDMASFLDAQPARPFVMGETIIGTSWPDTAVLIERLGGERPWWAPKGLDGFAAFEAGAAARFGEGAVARLRAHGDRFALSLRKSQCEILRSRPYVAGWVMNHLCDVSVCQCGFRDDLDRWRFGPEELLPFLGDRALLLRTPGHASGLRAGESCPVEIGISNFAEGTCEDEVLVEAWVETESGRLGLPPSAHPLHAGPGEVAFAPGRLDLSGVSLERPARVTVRASTPTGLCNEWRLWALPDASPVVEGVVRAAVEPFSAEETSPSFEEKRYSSGWALECVTWRPRLPDAASLLEESGVWDEEDTSATIVTERLTGRLVGATEAGARVLLLASGARGSPPTKWVNLYGQVPLILEAGDGAAPGLLTRGESDWLVDTLGLDLNRNCCRAVPSHALGLADRVSPVVRLVMTHDKGTPEPWDQLFFARVGRGVLAVSTLDHDCAAGRYLLRRVLAFLRADAGGVRGELEPSLVREWAGEG